MNGLLEIQTTNKWLIDYDFGVKAMRIVNAMANGHLLGGRDEKVYGERCYEQADGSFALHTTDDDGDVSNAGKMNEPFIDVLFLDGPITREGGACTYGSRQLRDMMMDAADTEGCLGHLLLINGPGGVSNAIPDFQQATDYARSKGQPIVGRIDGYCASAHIWIATMCDEVYYNLPTDQIGSVGIYWADILNKDGDTDPETGGKWHIVYDPASYDKNRFVRELAENDDDTLIKEELIRDGEVFRNYIKSRRPNATDEHLHGKMFDAKDVEGILVDGQKSLTEVFSRIVELAKKVTAANQSAPGGFPAGNDANTLSTQTNTINMKEQFPALFAALQVEEMQMQEGGAFMNEGLLANLNAAIEESQKAAADAKALADQLTAEKAELEQKLETANSDHAAAIESLNAEHTEAIAALEQEKADLQKAMDEKQETLDATAADLAKANDTLGACQQELDGAKASLETAEQTIAERDQQVADLNAQLTELQNAPGEQPAAGAAPANNGGAEAPRIAVSTPVAQPGQDYNEMRETWGDNK